MRAYADESLMSMAEAQHMGRGNVGDEKLFVTFELFPVKDEVKSAEAGHPVFEDVPFIRKVVPGDKNNIIHRPANDVDKRQFARQWAAFKEGQSAQMTGLPLKEWPQITRSEVENLAYFKVFTVEHLAELSDGAILQVGPVRHLVEKAKAFLAAAKEAAPAARLAEAIKAKDNEMEVLRRQLKEATDAIAELRRKTGGK